MTHTLTSALEQFIIFLTTVGWGVDFFFSLSLVFRNLFRQHALKFFNLLKYGDPTKNSITLPLMLNYIKFQIVQDHVITFA